MRHARCFFQKVESYLISRRLSIDDLNICKEVGSIRLVLYISAFKAMNLDVKETVTVVLTSRLTLHNVEIEVNGDYCENFVRNLIWTFFLLTNSRPLLATPRILNTCEI